jgi:lipoyl(octanoyl) transferase
MVDKVQVWVFSGDEVLLLKTTPARGGGWQPITGSVEPGEDSRQAALRELLEETGIQIPPRLLPQLFKDIGHEFEFESRWGGTARERVWACDVATMEFKKESVRIDISEHFGFFWLKIRQAEILLEHESAKKALILAAKVMEKNF